MLLFEDLGIEYALFDFDVLLYAVAVTEAVRWSWCLKYFNFFCRVVARLRSLLYFYALVVNFQ